MNIVAEYLKRNNLGLSRPGIMKISGQVIGEAPTNIVVFNGNRPAYFVKAVKKAGRGPVLFREFENLNFLLSSLPGKIVSALPRPLSFGDLDESTVILVETFLRGEKIALGDNRALEKLLKRSFKWLKEFAAATSAGSFRFDAAEALMLAEKLLERDIYLKGLKPKIKKFMDTAKESDGLTIPACASQGDFDFDNILLRKDGIGVADWEDYKPDSHPFLDAEFMLFNTAQYFYTACGHVESFRKFYAPFSRQRAIAEPVLEDYCRSVNSSKKAFYLMSVVDTIGMLLKGYGAHKKVPMQDTCFLGALLDLAFEEAE